LGAVSGGALSRAPGSAGWRLTTFKQDQPPRDGAARVLSPAADLTRPIDVLDRIDEAVALGVTLNPDDNSYGAHEFTPAARRR
jgi:hypothetical protein